MTNLHEVKLFKFEEMNIEISTVSIDGIPYFIAKYITDALGYKNPPKAVKDHVDEEDKLTERIVMSGQNRNVTLINESGLYSLILKSKQEEAKKFKRWVTSEVLPTIRKTGGYVSNEQSFIDMYLPFADESTKLMFGQTLEVVRQQNEKLKQQEKEIKYKAEVIEGLTDEISLADKRQLINKVVRSAGTVNIKNRWTELYKEFDMKYKMNTSLRMNNYNENNKPKVKNKIDYIDKVEDMISELYEIACKLYEVDIDKLVKQMYINRNIAI